MTPIHLTFENIAIIANACATAALGIPRLLLLFGKTRVAARRANLEELQAGQVNLEAGYVRLERENVRLEQDLSDERLEHRQTRRRVARLEHTLRTAGLQIPDGTE